MRVLPDELERWIDVANAARRDWKRDGVADGASAGRCCCARCERISQRAPAARETGCVEPREPASSRSSAPAPAIPSCSRCARSTGCATPTSCSTTRSSSKSCSSSRRRRSGSTSASAPAATRSIRTASTRLMVRAARARRARGPPQVRRSVRARPRRRRSARARGRRRRLRGRARPVSSAIAAPALAGIPVTHRGIVCGLRRRLGSRRVGVRARLRRHRARLAHARRADGPAHARRPRRALDRARLGRRRRPPRSCSARRTTGSRALARHARDARAIGAISTPSSPACSSIGEVVSLATQIVERARLAPLAAARSSMSVTDSPAPVPVGRLGFARHEDVDLFVAAPRGVRARRALARRLARRSACSTASTASARTA